MTAIYITLAVLAYLLIGSVVIGIIMRFQPDFSDDKDWLAICVWPLFVIIGGVVVSFRFLVYLAKRIGGVK